MRRLTSLQYAIGVLAFVAVSSRAEAEQNAFGVQSRADAAQLMIVLAVEQGIASLPPTSGQSFAYEYDPKSDTYRRGEQLGPTAFRSTQTIGAGHLTVRLAESYFTAARTLGPIDYTVTGAAFPPGNCTRFGLSASTQVALTNLSATYGVGKGLDISVNIPLVVSDVHASELNLTANPNQPGRVDPAPCDQLDSLTVKSTKFSDIPGVRFNDGTHFGLGRISIGGKVKVGTIGQLQLALAPDFFFPSPNQSEFAGPDSAAIGSRLIGQLAMLDRLRLHVDIGYQYDFSYNELSGLTWNTGLSAPFHGLGRAIAVDAGIGGSRFNQGITWTPHSPPPFVNAGDTTTLESVGNNQLGNTFVDFLGGIKIAIMPALILSGAVDVPLNAAGYRPDAIGTVALELNL